MNPEREAAAAALRRRGEDTVTRLLRENEYRWRSLSAGDRLRVESLARDVAARLLDEPTRRLGRAANGAGGALDVQAVAELFTLDLHPSAGARPVSPRRRREGGAA
jgi:glutamyl-tRNA reductase